MTIEPESIREAGRDLADALADAVTGYGPNANVTALAIVARVRHEPADDLDPDSGQTIVVPNVATNVDITEDERRAYLAFVLDDAAATLRVPYTEPDDLPSIDD